MISYKCSILEVAPRAIADGGIIAVACASAALDVGHH